MSASELELSPTIGSLFAGIGGFDLGFERAGFKTIWQCEIDKAAQGVLRRHFPDATLHSDVCQVGAHNLEPVDVVTYGFPCQDLSVAGKRAGLAGGRSGLFHEAVRIIRELRERYGSPRFAIAENVPGLFSSGGGEDFRVVLHTLLDIGARDVAWRILDSRYFGVAQRRRRVFLVADFGGERAEQILFEPESLRGDSKKGGAKRKEVARGAGEGAASGGWPARLSATLDTSFGDKMGLENQHVNAGCPNFVPAQPVAAGAHPPAVAFAQNTRDEVRLLGGDGQIVGALAAQPGMKQTTYVAQAIPLQEVGKRTGVSTNDVRAGIGIGVQGDPMFTLQAGAQHGVAQPIAFHPTQDPISSEDGISHAMSSGSKGGTATATVAVPSQAVCVTGEVTHALTASITSGATEDGTGRGVPLAAHPSMQIRRLTVRECEALQGFPCNHTAEVVLSNGTTKPQADGPRYKQLGNAVTVNVAEWIGRRVMVAFYPDEEQTHGGPTP